MVTFMQKKKSFLLKEINLDLNWT